MSERISYVEIDLKRCSNTYGDSPCAASGDSKCFNSYATCQDTDNFASEDVTTRYSTVSGDVNDEIECIPNVSSISVRPAKLNLGESIGVRASGTITFKDHRSPDTGQDGDRYLSTRDYNPYERGTYWGKFRARFPFMQGRSIRLLLGTIDQSIDQISPRHFIIDRISGPDSSGTVTLTFKDALALADEENAKAPLLSSGYLSADITDSATSLAIDPSGAGSDYPSSGTAAIGGKEMVDFTRSGDVFTITRGQYSTDAVEHDADDAFQIVLQYSAQTVTSIIYDLLTTYAGVPTSYINFSVWAAEDAAYINRLYSGNIPQPESVTDLINELLEQTASTIWWDDSAKLIRFRVLRDVSDSATLYDSDLMVRGTFSAADQPSKRVSQAWTYYNQISPLEEVDQRSNYANGLATTDPQSEINFDDTPAIKEVYSRWIGGGGRDAATRLNNLLLARYSTPPRMFSFNLHRNDALVQPLIGSGYLIKHPSLQDETGLSTIVKVQTVQVDNNSTGHKVMAEEVLYSSDISPDDPTVKNVFIDENITNINLYTYLTTEANQTEPVSGDTVNFYLDEGFVIGSTNTSSFALDTGIFPAGVEVNFYNYGAILGKGGRGGDGGGVRSDATFISAGDGGNGGDAVRIRTDINIINDGLIAGGGGGGGGGGAATDFNSNPEIEASAASGGGGGGAGYGYNPQEGSSGGVAVDNSFADRSDSVSGQNGSSTSENITSTSAANGSNGIAYESEQEAFSGESGFVNALAKGGIGGRGASIKNSIRANAAPGLPGQIGTTQSAGSAGSNGTAIVQTSGTLTLTGSGTTI